MVLINTLGLTELVSDALGRRKQKEVETNPKIVDLLKYTLEQINDWDGSWWLCARSWLARHPAKTEITGSSWGSSHHTKFFFFFFFFAKIMNFLDF